ncbi:MipA/OmpV family protein [Aliikangiella sp. IMCC44359]|uniref:MipA/OmpV family protein n=1 Tax=Aliikangiella sp. IMCC44359 TaxID=3459125 RepID=UPI00403A8E88
MSSLTLSAQTACTENSHTCVEVGKLSLGVSLGLGARTNPLINGDSIPLVVLPSFSYYGENFFIDNLDIGYTLYDNTPWMLNILLTPSYDRAFFERWDISNIVVEFGNFSVDSGFNSGSREDNVTDINAYELKRRKFSMMGGMELSTSAMQGQLQVQFLNDVSDVHSGNEVRFAYLRHLGNLGWSTTLGFSWKDKNMTDYYYGVNAEEIVDNRAAYQAKSSLNPFLRLGWREKNDSSNFWRFGIEYQQLDQEIANSPLVDKNYVLTAFIGKQLSF